MEELLRIPNLAEGIAAVLHLPDPPLKRKSMGVLMVHSQGGSKIGHKRSFVEIGRRLEEERIPALRFDLLGEGESESLIEDPYTQWRGLRPVIDYFWSRCELKGIIALGDCFGGLLAAHYARLEPKISYTIAWNLAQMNWTADLLEGYPGACERGSGVRGGLRARWQTLSSWKDVSLSTRNVVRRIKALVGSICRIMDKANGHPQELRIVSEGTHPDGHEVRLAVIHSPSQPGSAQAIATAQYVFQKLGMRAEHFFIAGVPFSAAWKAIAFDKVQSVVQLEQASAQ